MSAYNRIELSEREACPNCGSCIVRIVQFKYGEVWQHTYRVGDPLVWGENNIGAPGHHKVIASAHPEGCPVCGDVPEFRYEVLLEDA
jgi:hypothetical protein